MLLQRRTFLAATLGLFAPLTGLSVKAQEKPKVGFVFLGSVGDHGWNYAHERGRRAVAAALGDLVDITTVESVAEGRAAEAVMRDLANSDHKLIFATSFDYMNAAVKVAGEFPEIYFEHVGGFQRTANLATYNARYYEGRSVTGTIAGHMSKSGRCGYVASFPIPEVVRGINAFTLAARKVNPDFETHVVWMNSWNDPVKEAQAARELIERKADIISVHVDSPAALQIAEEWDVFTFGQASDMSAFAPDAHLSAISNDWSTYYISRVQAVLDGTWTTGDSWFGLREGGIGITPFGKAVSPRAAAAANRVISEIKSGSWQVFSGPIHDQTGTLRVARGEVLGDSQLKTVNWFAEGVKT